MAGNSAIVAQIMDRIREEKARRGLTASECSRQSGIPEGTLSKLLNGGTDDPRLYTVVSVLKGLGISIDDILGIDPPAAEKNEPPALSEVIRYYDAKADAVSKNKRILILILFINLFTFLTSVLVLIFLGFWYIKTF